MNMNQIASGLYNALTESDERKPKPYDTKAEVLRVEDDIVWVKIPGGVDETPVSRTNNANPGDQVMVRISGGRAWLLGNQTNPATDDRVAIKAGETAGEAIERASNAAMAAEVAEKAAESAVIDAATAKDAAESASADAAIAKESADTAQASADTAIANAAAAQESANTAIENAATAVESATQAQTAAAQAVTDAATAQTSANTAITNASLAQSAAGAAQTAATQARTDAATASANAQTAIDAAREANINASASLTSLSVLQDVMGTLQWIAENGHYILTEDTSPVHGKYYFIKDGDTYTAIQNLDDTVNPAQEGYYEMSTLDTSIGDYISTHVALADEGLYLQTDAENPAATTRVLLSPTRGVVLYGPNGGEVANYGASTVIGSQQGFHVQIDGSEIGFYDGASRVAYINNKTLYITQSVVLDEMQLGNKKWSWRYDERDDSIFLKWIG